jgi:GNAT superfamily N-acetyltransferase
VRVTGSEAAGRPEGQRAESGYQSEALFPCRTQQTAAADALQRRGQLHALVDVSRPYARMYDLHHTAMAGDHWYLAFIGVEPARQGRGLGAALLGPVLAPCAPRARSLLPGDVPRTQRAVLSTPRLQVVKARCPSRGWHSGRCGASPNRTRCPVFGAHDYMHTGADQGSRSQAVGGGGADLCIEAA